MNETVVVHVPHVLLDNPHTLKLAESLARALGLPGENVIAVRYNARFADGEEIRYFVFPPGAPVGTAVVKALVAEAQE